MFYTFDLQQPHTVFTSQPHLDTTPHTSHRTSSAKQVLHLWYISKNPCPPACASFPFHNCDSINPGEAPVPLRGPEAQQAPDTHEWTALADEVKGLQSPSAAMRKNHKKTTNQPNVAVVKLCGES